MAKIEPRNWLRLILGLAAAAMAVAAAACAPVPLMPGMTADIARAERAMRDMRMTSERAQRIQQLESLGRFEESEREARALVEELPEGAREHARDLLEGMAERRDDAAAEAAATQPPLFVEPSLVQGISGIPDAEPYWQRAAAELARGNLDGAIAACVGAQALIASVGDSVRARAIGLHNLAVAHHRRGDHARSIDGFREAIAIAEAGRRAAPAIRRSDDGEAAAAAAMERHLLAAILPTMHSSAMLAAWRAGDILLARSHAGAALAIRAETGIGHDDASEAAALRRLDIAALELGALATLDLVAGVSGVAGPMVGLPLVLERKGVVLDRITRDLAELRRQAPPPSAPAAANVLALAGQLVGLDVVRDLITDAELANARRMHAANRELLTEYCAAADERSRLSLIEPTSDGDRQARDGAVAQLDLRLRRMQREIARRATALRADPLVWSLGRSLPRMDEASADARLEEMMRRLRQAAAPPTPAQIQASLPAGSVLLEFVRFRPLDPRYPGTRIRLGAGDRYAAYILRRDAPIALVNLGEAWEIDAAILSFRRALAAPDDTEAVRRIARALDERLMRPLRRHVGDVEQLIVAPDGQINLVPFAALVDEQGRFLIERHRIRYVASGRDLVPARATIPARSGPVVVAAPAFDASRAPPQTTAPALEANRRSRDFPRQHYQPLPGAAEEGQRIAAMLEGVTLLTGAAATESVVKALRGPRILHVATHGFFLARAGNESDPLDNPMLRSGLVLAGANALASGDQDGVLTAMEAASLDLDGTALVVLSACETGVGEIANGEGVLGLRRALTIAGAETLVMSLWQIEDDATRALMVHFYSGLARGADRDQALRAAQLALLADGARAHPFYWASFIASGRTGPIR